MFPSRGVDRFVIDCLENIPCLKSDSDSEGTGTKRNKKRSRNERQKKDMKSLVWEIIFYAVFLTLLICTAFDNRDQRSYGFHSSILAAADPKAKISEISTPQEMFDWMRTYLFPYLYGTTSWDNSTLEDNRRVTASLASYRLGPTRIRQHRTYPESCEAPYGLWMLPVRCIPSWSSGHYDWSDYGPGWTAPDTNISADPEFRSPWQYSLWADVGGTPVAGRLGIYPNGGYVEDLSGTLEEVIDGLTQLQKLRWVDQWTKVVFVETTIYTPNINMFAMITAIFEFPQAMVIQAQFYTHPFKLLTYVNDYPVSAKVFDFLLFIAIVWFVFRLIFKLCRWRWAFFLGFWNVLELMNMFLALAVIVLYIGRKIVSEVVAKEAAKTTGHFYNFQTLAMWDQLFGFLLGFCCCLSTLKVLHLFRFNRRLSLLGATMRRATRDLIGFSFMYGLIMAAFVSFSFQVFCSLVYSYSTIIGTIQSLLLLTLGDMQYEKISSVNRLCAPVLITAYMALIVFILLNVLITILMDSFAIARDAIKEQANDFELLDYMTKSLKFMVTTPWHKFWSFVSGSPPSEMPRKPDGGSGSGAALTTASRIRDSIRCQKQSGIPRLRNKHSFPRTVRFTSQSLMESPKEPTRYFTPKAGKYLKNKSLLHSAVGTSKIMKKCLMRELSSSTNAVEENTDVLLRQLDVIDQRLDRLWQIVAADECGPPPELDTICRWREVKVTVADVISQHLGYQDDSDDVEEDLSNSSIDSDENYVEMSIAKLRMLVQRERRNMLSLENLDEPYNNELGFAKLSDDNSVDDIDGSNNLPVRTEKNYREANVKTPHSDPINTVTVFVEHHVYPTNSANFNDKGTAFSDEIVTLCQDDLFFDNDMYLSDEEDSSLCEHSNGDWDQDTLEYLDESMVPDEIEKEEQDQVVPSGDILQPEDGFSKQENSHDSNVHAFTENGDENKVIDMNMKDKTTQIDVETPLKFENMPGKSVTSNGTNYQPLDICNITQAVYDFDLEKSCETEPEFQVVEETKSCLKPFSLSAAENDTHREPRYRQRKSMKLNLDSPVATLIKKTNKKMAKEKKNLPTGETLTPFEKLSTHYKKGIRPSSWPEARSSSLANLDILIEVDTPSPKAKPGITAHFFDVFNDTGYQSAAELDKDTDDFVPKNLVVPILAVTPAVHSDSELTWVDETRSQPINKDLPLTPPKPCSSLRGSPNNERRLSPALTPRLQVVDENKVSSPSELYTTNGLSSLRRSSSFSLKSPLLLKRPVQSPLSCLTPNGKSNAFAMGALAAAPQLSKRRCQTRQTHLANSDL